MEFENQGIECKKFWDTKEVIKKAEDKMKTAKANKEKRYYAQDILQEAESLLLCSNFNSGNPDCVSCHSILRRYIKEYKYLAKEEAKKNSIIK